MHLFCAIPNYSGSTLIHNCIATDKNVATLRIDNSVTSDFVEGDMLSKDSYRLTMNSQLYTTDAVEQYKCTENYDWQKIKTTWKTKWSEVEGASVFLQKTPADFFRVEMMMNHFENLKWIIAVKDPYAYVESLFRQYFKLGVISPYSDIDKLCTHVILAMQAQLENRKLLGESAYGFTLEDFLDNKKHHVAQIEKFTDGLVKIDLSQQIWIKGKTSGDLVNTNESKIQKLISVFPDILSKINQQFAPHEELLGAWGYSMRTK